MTGERRGFFREMLGRLRQLTEEVDEPARPTFVPPAHAETTAPSARAPRIMRPPGALDEAAFLAACTRCGDCLSACPEGTLVVGDDGFPRAEVEQHPCVMCQGAPCATACMTGALRREAVFAFGTARVGARLCLNHGRTGALRSDARPQDEADSERDELAEAPCERCVDWCPVPGAIVLVADALPVVDAARCTGCGACAAHCAAYPRAITIA